MSSEPHDGPEHLLREAAPRVLGALVRRFGDFAAAEDAVQEALLAALVQWPESGAPSNPGGWLYQVASRRMSDHVASEEARRTREIAAVGPIDAAAGEIASNEEPGAQEHDDTLELLFTCCHPSLSPPSAIALTLRALGGLTTAEIASAFLVPESTMAQRISRAKQTILSSGASFEAPQGAERTPRLRAVLHVLYLMFNEGYSSSAGQALQRVELAAEAIRLARALRRLAPEDPETSGLLALLLLTDARRRARTGARGELIPLDEQDRTLWDRDEILEGTAIVRDALSKGAVGAYQIQG